MSFLVLAVPADLAAGRYPAPAWAILALGGAVVAGAAVYLGVRSRFGEPHSPGRGRSATPSRPVHDVGSTPQRPDEER